MSVLASLVHIYLSSLLIAKITDSIKRTRMYMYMYMYMYNVVKSAHDLCKEGTDLVFFTVTNQLLPELCVLLYGVTSRWGEFGTALHMNHDTIENIRLTPIRREPKDKMIVLLEKLRKNSSFEWKDIKKAVEGLRNHELKDKITKSGQGNDRIECISLTNSL